jgi:hypothetical protein
VHLDLGVGGLVERAVEQVVRVRASVAAGAGGWGERWRVEAGERGDEPRPGALNALVGSVGPDTEQLCELRRRPVLRIVEYDGDSVSGRELAQRGPEGHLLFGRSEHGGWILDVGDQCVELVEVPGGEAGLPAVGIDDAASEDAA